MPFRRINFAIDFLDLSAFQYKFYHFPDIVRTHIYDLILDKNSCAYGGSQNITNNANQAITPFHQIPIHFWLF